MVALVVAVVGMSGVCTAQDRLTLAKKAALFEHDIHKRFLFDGQVACKLKVPTANRPFVAYNMPDNAYMTGIYLGARAMKYAVTKAPEDREAARAAIRALNLLCTVSGKKGLLARAAWPLERPFEDDGIWRESPDGKHKWRGDVSSDQMDGVMYGYAWAYDLVADEDEKRAIAKNVADLVDAVLANGRRIIGYDGKPTQWGNYTPGYVKLVEPMNALILLQHLKVAHHVTGDDRFDREYRRIALDEGYAEAAVAARRALWSINYSDDVLLFLAYYPLLKYEKDPKLRDLYLRSLRRTWESAGKYPGADAQANPFYAFIVRDLLGDDSGVKAGVATLRWFPLDMKWNRDTIAGYEKEFGFTFDPIPEKPVPAPGQSFPFDRRAKTWSAWADSPQTGDRSVDAAMEYNGHDYLAAYWLGRYLGLITPET